ncbi:MAG: chlorophyllase/cutinase-like alpha/beta fold protein [Erysipelotrichaceae bacterium]
MKKFKVVIIIIVSIFTLLVTGVFSFAVWFEINNGSEAALSEIKVTHNVGENDLEWDYSQVIQKVSVEYLSVNNTNYAIYYPSELKELYPVVVWSNGSLATYLNYQNMLQSLASYGFVVVANDDQYSGAGNAAYESAILARELNDDFNSIFYQKLNTDKIGVGGHSQGAAGAINAATQFKNSDMFKAIYTTSLPQHSLCIGPFSYWSYDTSLLQIPYFMTSGTGEFDDFVSPLSSLESTFNNVNNQKKIVMARQHGADHNVANVESGYLNAWFSYTLKNDLKAAEIFSNDGELFNNQRWVDAHLKP